MNSVTMILSVILAVLLGAAPAYAAEGEFDAESMLSELERRLDLSGDAMSKLKPALDAKSAELKKSINASLEQGFMELNALTEQLDTASAETTAKLKEALSSDEMTKLREYLSKIDKDAIASIRDQLVAELEELLKLTEGQIEKLRPVLEDAFDRLGEMLDRLAREGTQSLENFKKEYESLNLDLKQKLGEVLDGEQLKSLEMHREELGERIGSALFSG